MKYDQHYGLWLRRAVIGLQLSKTRKDTCTCFLQRFRGKPPQLIC